MKLAVIQYMVHLTISLQHTYQFILLTSRKIVLLY